MQQQLSLSSYQPCKVFTTLQVMLPDTIPHQFWLLLLWYFCYLCDIASSVTHSITITSPRTTNIVCDSWASECLIDCQVENACSGLLIKCPDEEELCSLCQVNCTDTNSCNNIIIDFTNCDHAEINALEEYSINTSLIYAPGDWVGRTSTGDMYRRRLPNDLKNSINNYNKDYNDNYKQEQIRSKSKPQIETQGTIMMSGHSSNNYNIRSDNQGNKRRMFTLPSNAKYLTIYVTQGYTTTKRRRLNSVDFTIYDTEIVTNKSTNTVIQIIGDT